jgi:hypothetical protein
MLLQHAQELDLGIQWKLTDLIQKQGAAVGQFEAPYPTLRLGYLSRFCRATFGCSVSVISATPIYGRLRRFANQVPPHSRGAGGIRQPARFDLMLA